MPYAVEVLSLIVKPVEAPVYSDLATVVAITDESGGPFVEITQPSIGEGSIRIDPEEWPAIKQAVDSLMDQLHWHTTV